MSVDDDETEQYGGVVVFLNPVYLCIVYVARMSTIYYLSVYWYFKDDNERERR